MLRQQQEAPLIQPFLQGSAEQGEHPGRRPALPDLVPDAEPTPPAAAQPAGSADERRVARTVVRHVRRDPGSRWGLSLSRAKPRACWFASSGLGPGDPGYLTVGSLEALRAMRRVVALLAPPDLVRALESQASPWIAAWFPTHLRFVRGSAEAIDALRCCASQRSTPRDLAWVCSAIRSRIFPGFRCCLRALEAAGTHRDRARHAARNAFGLDRDAARAASAAIGSTTRWDDLIEIMARLRDGCPWDREQTHRTLVPYLIEETYEVVEAIEADDLNALCEELGDLLLQIVFHSQLGDRDREVHRRRCG